MATKPLSVTSYRDNPDGTTTNYLSDGSQDTGRLSSNNDGNYSFHPIDSSQLGPVSPFQLSQPEPSTAMDGLLGTNAAGADSFTKYLSDRSREREKAYQNSSAALMQAVFNSPGEAQLTDALSKNTTDPLEEELARLNGELRSEQHGLQTQLDALDKNQQGFFGTGLEQAKQKVKDESLRRQTDFLLQQDIRQGQYDRAYQRVQRTVSARLEQQKNLLDALQLNYQTNKDLFTTAEQRSFETMLSDRKAAQEKQAYAEKAYYESLIQQSDPKYQEELKQLQYQNSFIGGGAGGASDPVSAASTAILGNESNGSYTAMSPVLKGGSYAGQRSYGKYQVLESNIPSWTKQYYGQSLTPAEFLNNPAAQEAVQKGKIADLWNQYGNIQDVASVYFTGVPYAKAVAEGRKDQATGMTVQDYVAKAANAFNQSAGQTSSNPVVDSYARDYAAGKINLSEVPDYLRNAVVQKAGSQSGAPDQKKLQVVNDIDNLLNDAAFNSTFGLTNSIQRNIPGTQSYTLKAKVNNIVSQLALAARGQLKGQGQVSDFEGKLLRDAQTSLRLNMSPDQARHELVQVNGAIRTSSGLPAQVRITAQDGSSAVVNATQAGITQAVSDGNRVEYVDESAPDQGSLAGRIFRRLEDVGTGLELFRALGPF